MSRGPDTVTYLTPTGEKKELLVYTGKILTQQREKFAQLVAFGATPGDARAEAYGRPNETTDERKQRQSEGMSLLLDTDVRIRVQELRRPIQRKLLKKWEYTLDHALEDCQKAWDVAYANGDSKSMQSCVRLRAELTKLLSTEVNVTHKYGVLDTETTEVLMSLKDALKRKKATVKIISGDSTEEKRNWSGKTPNAPLLVEG